MTRRPSALQDPAGLGARVVELAGLADDDRAGADHHHGLDVLALRHAQASLLISSTNRSKRYAASCGPAAASGWYWTEKLFRSPASSRSSRPSTTSSLRQTWLTLGDAVRRGRGRVEGRVDREAVVVRGDLDLAGGAVHHRLVDAAVAVLQLVGAEAERAAEELVAEADAEVRQVAGQGTLEHLDLLRRRGGVAGAVGVEEPVGLHGEHVVERRVGRAARAPRCRARPSGTASSS